MPNLNKVMLMGNLTRDPELRYTPNNTPVVNLGMAINDRWRNQQGEQQESTTFVDCEAFGRTAEVINQYMRKGRPIYLEGRLKLDQWQDKDGNNRSKLKVVVLGFQFIDSNRGDGGGGGGGGGGGYEQQGGGARGGAAPAPSAGGADGGGGHQPVEPDDIPF